MMKSVYRVLAYLIAALVVIQAGAIAFAVFGLTNWVDQGGTLDAGSRESGVSFIGDSGFMIHGISGTMVIPVVALALLIISFFAKVPGGVKWALFVVAAVVVQVALGIFAHGAAALGALHGGLALVLLLVAVEAGRRVVVGSTAQRAETPAPAGP